MITVRLNIKLTTWLLNQQGFTCTANNEGNKRYKLFLK